MTVNNQIDPLDQIWCCMTCNTTFRFGKLKTHDPSYETHPHGLACPNCSGGLGLHPADGGSMALEEYHGERGTLQ